MKGLCFLFGGRAGCDMERFDVERIIGGLGLNDPPLLELAAVLELATVSQSLALEPLPLRPGLCHQDAFIRKVERPPDPPVFSVQMEVRV
mmetsp:Transcript_31387/g.64200  ORF Transcript_31387/g.64200 Transcript_31387/m.64200 type:complete len:90 (-) Transcript_31387:482-751(-)